MENDDWNRGRVGTYSGDSTSWVFAVVASTASPSSSFIVDPLQRVDLPVEEGESKLSHASPSMPSKDKGVQEKCLFLARALLSLAAARPGALGFGFDGVSSVSSSAVGGSKAAASLGLPPVVDGRIVSCPSGSDCCLAAAAVRAE